jgi:hypothetical protein
VPTHSAHSAQEASSDHLNRHLSLYSLAAAAAGVSMLALAQPAQSEVVITKKTIPVPPNQGQFGVGIDLNHDGVMDFFFDFRFQSNFGDLLITANKGELIGYASFGSEFNGAYASALRQGAKIGPSARFSSVSIVTVERSYPNSTSSRKLRGKWDGNQKNRYLGVRFLINGENHYGWIRLTVDTRPMSATITGYAYETVANKPIVAGTVKTSAAEAQVQEMQYGPSLGMLAHGADGLPLWRRENPLDTI